MALDLAPAAEQLAALVRGVGDHQLADPTPCHRYAVGDLLDHIGGLALAFTEAARKSGPATSGPPPAGDVANLDPAWRTTIPERLRALAEAWRDPAAYEGMTNAGGVEMPGDIAGTVALEEITVHGWDLARATGQPFAADDGAVEAVVGFASMFAHEPEMRGDAYGAPVEVGPDADGLDVAVALTGRDPNWAPPAT